MPFSQLTDKATIELTFSSCKHSVELEKLVFTHPALKDPLISIRADYNNSISYRSIPWNRPTQEMALLLTRYLETTLRKPTGNAGIATHTRSLAVAVRSQEDWLKEIFGKDLRGSPLCNKIFILGTTKSTAPVSLNTKALPAANITLILDNKPLTTLGEFIELAAAIKRAWCSLVPPTIAETTARRYTTTPPSIIDEIRHMWSDEMPAKLLRVFDTDRTSSNPIASLMNDPANLNTKELAIHLLQHTTLRLLDDTGAARHHYHFEIINAGLRPLISRTHQFWFEVPHGDIPFLCTDASGTPIRIAITRALPNYRQVNILLPKPLQPLERFSYDIQFDTTGNPRQEISYHALSPRTVTKILKFTLLAPYSFDLQNSIVTHESRDGFLRDDPPTISYTQYPELQRLHWECSSPKPGEVIRTFWSDANVSHSPANAPANEHPCPLPERDSQPTEMFHFGPGREMTKSE